MSICEFCGLEMLKAPSCTKKEIFFPDGSVLPAIKYKAPTIKELEEDLKIINRKEHPLPPKVRKIFDTQTRKIIKELKKKKPKIKVTCHDCNVQDEGYHHPGCDMEICPKCGGQLITCLCEGASVKPKFYRLVLRKIFKKIKSLSPKIYKQ